MKVHKYMEWQMLCSGQWEWGLETYKVARSCLVLAWVASDLLMAIWAMQASVYCHINWNVVTRVKLLVREQSLAFISLTASLAICSGHIWLHLSYFQRSQRQKQQNCVLVLCWQFDHEDRDLQKQHVIRGSLSRGRLHKDLTVAQTISASDRLLCNASLLWQWIFFILIIPRAKWQRDKISNLQVIIVAHLAAEQPEIFTCFVEIKTKIKEMQ